MRGFPLLPTGIGGGIEPVGFARLVRTVVGAFVSKQNRRGVGCRNLRENIVVQEGNNAVLRDGEPHRFNVLELLALPPEISLDGRARVAFMVILAGGSNCAILAQL